MQKQQKKSKGKSRALATSNMPLQMEREYTPDVKAQIHLHLNIGSGNHLQIYGKRHNIMDGTGYSQTRMTEALDILQRIQNIDAWGHAECEAWLISKLKEQFGVTVAPINRNRNSDNQEKGPSKKQQSKDKFMKKMNKYNK